MFLWCSFFLSYSSIKHIKDRHDRCARKLFFTEIFSARGRNIYNICMKIYRCVTMVTYWLLLTTLFRVSWSSTKLWVDWNKFSPQTCIISLTECLSNKLTTLHWPAIKSSIINYWLTDQHTDILHWPVSKWSKCF